jgi:hypothetical protein
LSEPRGRVTILGEVSPIGSTIYFEQLLEITKVFPIFGLRFSSVKVMHSFWQQIGWATFLAISSQTHLVTLLRGK